MQRLLLNFTLCIWCFWGILLSACTSTAMNRVVHGVSPYFQGTGGAGIRLAILEPRGDGLSASEQSLLSRMRAVLLYDFTSFSHVVLVDQEQLDSAASVYTTIIPGVFSDEDSAGIGILTSAQYILHGSISKEEADRFTVQVAIVAIESRTRVASYTALVSFEELWSVQAVQQAFRDCARQLGITLTEAGESAVTKRNTSGIQAALAYAQALEARKSGRIVEELHYLHSAVTQEPLLNDAKKRLTVLSALLSQGNALVTEGGQDAEAWRNLLITVEQFYENLLLFDVVHSQTPFIDDETGALAFFVSLCRNGSAAAMQALINEIRTALSSMPDLEEFNQWPLVPALPRDKMVSVFSINDYRVEFGLYNSKNELLARTTLFLQTQTVFFEGEVLTDSTQQRIGTFPELHALDEGSFIKVLTINELDAEQLQIQGIWRIVSQQELPHIRPRPAYFTQGKTAAIQEEAEKPLKGLDWFRLGIGVTGYFLNASENVLNDDPNSLQGIVELGIKWVSLEAFIHSSYGSLASIATLSSLESAHDTIAYGFGAGFTFVGRFLLFNLGGGYSHYLDKADTVFVQTKLDLVPESFGLGLRLGYKADLFTLAGENSFQFNGKVMAGLLFWL
ncbi:MAG: hypothetical protein LBO67_06045 [Spirochaetaceae bacterium]|jgi:hypothetical protein|nr:hypothetical protein [Spirochaetaceae bacterium]